MAVFRIHETTITTSGNVGDDLGVSAPIPTVIVDEYLLELHGGEVWQMGREGWLLRRGSERPDGLVPPHEIIGVIPQQDISYYCHTVYRTYTCLKP